jgi:FkbM family methyltransferase
MVGKLTKRLIIALTPKKLIRFYQSLAKQTSSTDAFLNDSYAQEGEDMVLSRFFGSKNNGFYVDVGAHHPQRFSNTYTFYKRGWKGINIDAMPGSMELFEKLRPRDTNLELGVSSTEESATYYIFNEPALNTFSEEEARKKNGIGNYKIIRKLQIPSLKLCTILDRNVPPNINIDFMSIDVEGLDMDVLISNDWNKYRPHIIVVEDIGFELSPQALSTNKLYQFLVSYNYELVGKTYNTLFFKECKSI